jgi:hypothetical protein
MSFGPSTRIPTPVCRVDPSQGAGNDALPAAIVSIQTAGEFFTGIPTCISWLPREPSDGQGWPGAAGVWMRSSGRMDGSVARSPAFAAAVLRVLFQADVPDLLLKEWIISQALVERMRKWRHFSAIRGRRRVRFESSQCAMGEKVARPI